MTARLLLRQEDIDLDRPSWLARRREGITASEMPAILGINPDSHSTPRSVWEEKVTGEYDASDAKMMARGRYLEPLVIEMFEGFRPELYITGGGLYASEQRPWQLATFDRLALDTVTAGYIEEDRRVVSGMASGPHGWAGWPHLHEHVYPVQIKTAATRHPGPDPLYWWGKPGTDEIPRNYRAQCLWELDTWGAKSIIIPVLFMDEWTLDTYVIDLDDEVEKDINWMRGEAAAFMERVAHRDPPPVDWRPATRKALQRLTGPLEDREERIPSALAKRYQRALRASAKAEKRLKLAQNEMLAAGGNARYLIARVDGEDVKVATRSKHGRKVPSSDILRNRFPDAYAASLKETPIDAFYPSGWANPRGGTS